MLRKIFGLVLALGMMLSLVSAGVPAPSVMAGVATANAETVVNEAIHSTPASVALTSQDYLKSVAQTLLNNTLYLMKLSKKYSNITNETSAHYELGVNLTVKAQEALADGNYSMSIQYTLKAMKEFKFVIRVGMHYKVEPQNPAGETKMEKEMKLRETTLRARTIERIVESYMNYALKLGEEYNDTQIITTCAEMQKTIVALNRAINTGDATQIEELTHKLEVQMEQVKKVVMEKNRMIIRERAIEYSKKILEQFNETITQLKKTNPEIAQQLEKEYKQLEEQYKRGNYLSVVIRGQYIPMIRKLCMPPMYNLLLVREGSKISMERLDMVISLERTALLQLAMRGENVTIQFQMLMQAQEYLNEAKRNEANSTRLEETALKLISQIADYLDRHYKTCHEVIIMPHPIMPQPLPPWKIIREEHHKRPVENITQTNNQTITSPSNPSSTTEPPTSNTTTDNATSNNSGGSSTSTQDEGAHTTHEGGH